MEEVLIDRRKRLTSLEGFSCELCKDKHVFLVVIWHLLSFFANWVQYPRQQGPGSSDITMNRVLTDDMELEQAATTPFPSHEREKRVSCPSRSARAGILLVNYNLLIDCHNSFLEFMLNIIILINFNSRYYNIWFFSSI
ncbi:hypothetical protein Hdeb2414_s0011g00370261 [Helianthus debilis subsp. tardiflorus]